MGFYLSNSPDKVQFRADVTFTLQNLPISEASPGKSIIILPVYSQSTKKSTNTEYPRI